MLAAHSSSFSPAMRLLPSWQPLAAAITLLLLLLLTPVLLVTRLRQRVLRTLVLVLIPMPGVSAVVAFFLIDLTAPDTDAVVAAMAAGATNACDGTDRPPWSPSHHQR